MRDIFAMREVAQYIDARNRVIPPDSTPRCKCGNMLTIADRGNTCRQCRLTR